MCPRGSVGGNVIKPLPYPIFNVNRLHLARLGHILSKRILEKNSKLTYFAGCFLITDIFVVRNLIALWRASVIYAIGRPHFTFKLMKTKFNI